MIRTGLCLPLASAYIAAMIARFLSRLTARPAPAFSSQEDAAQLALAALLVRVARADGHYAADEQRGIEAVLARRHQLSAAEAAALRQRGEALESDSSDAVRFTRVLKDQVPLDLRTEIVEALWEVALSDGSTANDEAMALRLMSSLLGLTDVESALARQKVQARLNGASPFAG